MKDTTAKKLGVLVATVVRSSRTLELTFWYGGVQFALERGSRLWPRAAPAGVLMLRLRGAYAESDPRAEWELGPRRDLQGPSAEAVREACRGLLVHRVMTT